jgi:hypothetical protein
MGPTYSSSDEVNGVSKSAPSSIDWMGKLLKNLPFPLPQTQTTLMVRNIPLDYTQEMLAEEWPCDQSYDFLYLPCSLSAERNLTYAFINFYTEQAAFAFQKRWHKKRLCRFDSRKALNVGISSVQGRDASIWLMKQKRANERKCKKTQPIIYFGDRLATVEEAIGELDWRISKMQAGQENVFPQSNIFHEGLRIEL